MSSCIYSHFGCFAYSFLLALLVVFFFCLICLNIIYKLYICSIAFCINISAEENKRHNSMDPNAKRKQKVQFCWFKHTHVHTHIHIREIHMHTYILRIDIVYNLQENKYIQSAGVQYSTIILKTSQK